MIQEVALAAAYFNERYIHKMAPDNLRHGTQMIFENTRDGLLVLVGLVVHQFAGVERAIKHQACSHILHKYHIANSAIDGIVRRLQHADLQDSSPFGPTTTRKSDG